MKQTFLARAFERTTLVVATAIITTVVIAGGVAYASVANNSVNSVKIVDGSVALVDLAANSVNSGKIANNAVAAVDLTPGVRASLVSGLVMVQQTAVADGSDSITAQADCPGALVAVAGGGEETDTSLRAFLVDSHPTDDGSGWVARYRSVDGNAFSAGDEVTAFASCGPA